MPVEQTFNIILRKCSRCNKYKSLDNFSNKSSSKDGLNYRCKTCDKELYEDWFIKNKERRLEYWRNYELINKKKRLEKNRKYIKKHKKDLKEYMKKYRKTKSGKRAIIRGAAKHGRNLKFIPIMENPFPEEVDIHWHHINKFLVIPLPAITHRKCLGFKHKEYCNNKIIDLYGINLNKILGD